MGNASFNANAIDAQAVAKDLVKKSGANLGVAPQATPTDPAMAPRLGDQRKEVVGLTTEKIVAPWIEQRRSRLQKYDEDMSAFYARNPLFVRSKPAIERLGGDVNAVTGAVKTLLGE